MTESNNGFMRRDVGFTLIELVVVVAILTVLAGILIPMVSHEVDDARTARAVADMKMVATCFNAYRNHTGAWPRNTPGTNYPRLTEDLRQFTCLYANTYNFRSWNGPYLNVGENSGGTYTVAGTQPGQGLQDPWDRAYVVQWYPVNGQMGVGGGIVLQCLGRNGVSDSSAAAMAEGQPGGDDSVVVVTRRL